MNKVKLGNKSMIYPYPSTILTTKIDGRKNYMQVGFAGIVNANPGMAAMGIGKPHFTTQALKEGAVIGLAIANKDMMLKADYVGIRSGKKVDKSNVFETFTGDNGAVLIDEAPINLELKIIKAMDLGGLDVTIIAEILEVYADENVMTGKNPDITKINPLVFSMYENQYYTLGENVGKGWSIGLTYERLEKFVMETIFDAFDRLEDAEYFSPYIDNMSTFVFDDKIYKGFEGFSTWLQGVKSTLKKVGLEHNITKFDAKVIEKDSYEVSFNVGFKGETVSGEIINRDVKETWLLTDKNGTFIFKSYLTK